MNQQNGVVLALASGFVRCRFARWLTVSTALFVIAASTADAAEERGVVQRTGVSKLDKTFAIEATHGLMRDEAPAGLVVS